MKRKIGDSCLSRTLFGLVWVFASLAKPADAAPAAIASRNAEIEGVKLHYLTAGHGPTVILLHGYAETSRMWRPLIPLLAEKFTVIAPDLPGIGDSAIPADKIDMKTSASRIHTLVRSLGVEKAQSRRARYRIDGGLCVCHAIPGGNREAGGNGCVSSRRARMGSDLQRSKYLAFSFQRRIPRSPGARDASAFTSNISGTFLPPIRRTRFRKQTEKRTPKHIRNRDGCGRRGLISLPGRNWPKISRNFLRRNLPCRCCRLAEINR